MDNSKIKVLVIEDAITEQEALRRLLSTNGLQVICASTGEEGIKRTGIEKPDIVIIDTVLPGMDGYEVCQQIRAMEDIAPKIIIQTGNVDALDINKPYACGADTYIFKSSGFIQLIKALKRVMDIDIKVDT